MFFKECKLPRLEQISLAHQECAVYGTFIIEDIPQTVLTPFEGALKPKRKKKKTDLFS